MSFREAEATDASLSGLAALLHTALEKPGYRRNPHQIYDNMDADPLIGPLPEPGKPASRIELLRQLSRHRANPSVIPDEVVLFCRAKPQQGPGLPNAETTTFGHVHRFDALVNAVVDPSRGMTLKKAKALLEDDIRAPAPANRLERQRTELADYTLGRHQMWSCPVGDPRNPFAEIGSTRADSVNVLGLGYFAHDARNEKLVRWAHTVPKSNTPNKPAACRPTAWDAGADNGSVHWRPGGRTYRLDRDEYGLPEVVHDPIKGENLVVAIEALS